MLFPEISDWRINPKEPEQSVYFKDLCPHPVSNDPKLLELARGFIRAIESHPTKTPERFDMELHGHWHRIERMPNGVHAIRVIPDRVPTLEELNIPAQYRAILLNERLDETGGLVLISGGAGSGKTTTAVATITERLRRYGGYGITYENPLEYRIQGFHGRGYMDQNAITNESLAGTLSNVMRCMPAQGNAFIFVGEILDVDTAREVFNIMMNGHLVFATSFGADIIGSIERFFKIIDAENNGAAREMFASNLKWVVHQNLTSNKRVQMRALEITRSAEQLIAHGHLLNLKDEIIRTEQRLERML